MEVLVAAGAQVTAVDRSAAMIERARARVPGARFVVGDVEEVRLGRGFDVIFSFNVGHYWRGQGDVGRLARALRRGGAMWFFYEPPGVVKGVEARLVERLRGFEVEVVRRGRAVAVVARQ